MLRSHRSDRRRISLNQCFFSLSLLFSSHYWSKSLFEIINILGINSEMHFWQTQVEKSKQQISEYKIPKPRKIVPNGKDHVSQSIPGNQSFTALTGSGTCFFCIVFFLFPFLRTLLGLEAALGFTDVLCLESG